MKKFFNYLCLAAIAATTLVACSKNETVEIVPEASVRTVNFNAKTTNPSTKTAFGDKTDAGYPTVWTSNEKVSISLNFASGVAADVIPSSNGKTASFNATLTDDESGEYVFYALSPAVAAISWSAGDYNSVNIDFPANQAPTLKSVDEKAHIMAAKSTAFTEFPDEDTPVSLSFSHLAAYGKFQFRNLPETVKIESIELNAAEPVAGRFYFYPKTGEITANSVGTIVTLNVDNLEIDKNNTTDFWFSFKPVNLQGKTLKISVHTDNGVYSKTITFPSGTGNFQAGRVASFSVNMDGITPGEDKVYKLVTDKNQLLPNTKVIIVAKEFNYAIGVVQNSNNRSQAEVTKETSASSEAIIKNPGDAVQIFNLERGTLDNTVAFKCVNGDNADKYIGASGAGNHLRSYADLGDNTSFDVTIGDGSTLLVANSSSDFGNILRYNSTNTNPGPIFSCYKASSSVQDEVALYALVGSGEGSSLIDDPKCPAPEISYNNSTKTVTITCSAAGATVGYTIDGTDPEEGSSSTIITDDLPIEFTITATTTVKAIAGAPGYRMSDIAEKLCTVSSGTTPDPVTMNIYSNEATVTGSGVGQTATWTSGDITVTAVKNESSATAFRSSDTDHTRFYSGWVITVSSESNAIDKVEFTCTTSNYANTLKGQSFTKGSATVSDKVVTVSNVDASSTSVTLGAQVRVSSIKVTYKD